ncbi:conserved hypothetical protein [Stutzerimonas stutzeri A1501]|uniref:Uncharacterized protein n=1 Tax=Stutzerimonas stutzeri (strain A1501) TaxID=379731 RepID=A4VRV7_STUS1|nr:conserved hypothetical protein [Stutzerimonas stutzeri A1501]
MAARQQGAPHTPLAPFWRTHRVLVSHRPSTAAVLLRWFASCFRPLRP